MPILADGRQAQTGQNRPGDILSSPADGRAGHRHAKPESGAGRGRGRSAMPSLDGDRLGQVSRLIDIRALQHGDVVGEQLQGHDVDDGRQ